MNRRRHKVLSIAEGRQPASTDYPFIRPELPEYLRSSDVQQVFGVRGSDVGRWISEGLLAAVPTEVVFRIEDVRQFAHEHFQEYDLRRADPEAIRQLILEYPCETPRRRPSNRQRKAQR